jgi:hypothetical protein
LRIRTISSLQDMATAGAKRKRQTYAPPSDRGPYLHHPVHTEYVGWLDGTLWSTKSGQFIEGRLKNGYTLLGIRGGNFVRHRFNFEIAHQCSIPELMEIDHMNTIKKDDAWHNLQQLTRLAHAAKTAIDNPDSGRKSSETQGLKLIATHIDTGETRKFSSQNDAAKQLGLDQANIGKHLRRKLKRVGRYTFEVDPVHENGQLDLPGEEWVDVPDDRAVEYGFTSGIMKGTHVSTLGRVQDKKERRSFGPELSSDDIGDSYMLTKVGYGEGRVAVRVHTLCALTFVGRRPSPTHTVDHIDGRKENNASTNLRWASPSEQGQNQRTNRPVHQLNTETGRIIRTFPTICEAARITSLHKAGMNMVCLGTRNGYAWKYAI